MKDINLILTQISKNNDKIEENINNIKIRNEELVKTFQDFNSEKQELQNELDKHTILSKKYPEIEYTKVDIEDDQHKMLQNIEIKQQEVLDILNKLKCQYSVLNHYPNTIKNILEHFNKK